MNLLENLNPAQKEATIHTHGALLIIAGAGSGKTRVITSRIANLLSNHSVAASQIVALTFTNKAAHEMKERIAALLGTTQPLPFVGTFHAYCVKLLKQYAALRDAPFNGILDTDDQHKIIKAILLQHGLQKQLNVNTIAANISQIKNRSTEPSRLLQEHSNKLFAEVYYAYEEQKKLNHCLDFDDLLLETVKLFNNPQFTQQFHTKIQHILVDEYQDTNVIQHLLLKKMCLNNNQLCVNSVCAVGDADQSIYSWRGATVTNMKNFLQDFPGTHTVKIEQNYRSAQQILDIANAVINHNTDRTAKKLWSEKKGNNRVHMLIFTSGYQEAESLAQLGLLLTEHQKNQNCAFLYRTHAQSRTLEEALVKHAVPYRIVGGVQFYERMEVKDLLAYLKLLVNPFDRIACARALNTPTRGLGAKAEELIFETWNEHITKPFFEIITILITTHTGARTQALAQFLQVFEELHITSTPSFVLQHIIKKTDYFTYLKNSYDKEEAAERCANVDELVNAAAHAESLGLHTVAEFLESVTLMQDHINKPKPEHNCILLMTLHAAKGLEFDTVVLAGLEEGVLPTSRATFDPESLEEERRLLYVGITRARERLLFTRSRTRHSYGKLTDQITSRFTKELPEHLVPNQDVSLWKTHMTRVFFAQWLGITSLHAKTNQFQNSPMMIDKNINNPIIPKNVTASFRIHQPVTHTSFGTGIIKLIEKKDTETIITVTFRTGTKKILSSFLSPL